VRKAADHMSVDSDAVQTLIEDFDQKEDAAGGHH
jgi:hypothetical protein